MRSVYGEDSSPLEVYGSSAQEEKILVSVRLRPLNERELSKNDVSEWECVNNTTIISKTSGQDRPASPTAYSFDRVFGNDSSTRQVYEEGAKEVALSVINGINASIFAYGQTSSGKTYTMSGITEYTLSDLYNLVNTHETREFVLKFAAMEIYNECVRDLLTSENTALRLLDDPERGTVVEKLTEVTLRDWDQLKELLSVCEAQRQIGETSLNQTSSRSHQILRLTVESSARKYSSSRNSDVLTATVSFVDLAGSERASQTMSFSTRLKEGCHINRSLLTLGTVIRKLSKGRSGHVPYRDSKLTRILQNSLGGNARTAIICTLSPAHSHVEQSRNTLLFASCAKQVTNTAQVNVVMSEKALVKLLKKELARLEKQLRQIGSFSTGSCDSLSALQEKERLIEKMDKEIRDLTQQRDIAHSRLQILTQVGGQSRRSNSWADSSTLSNSSHDIGLWPDDYSTSEVSEIVDPFRFEIASNASQCLSDRYEGTIGSNKIEEIEGEEQLLSNGLSPTKVIDKYFGPDPSLGWEKMAHTSNENIQDICKSSLHQELRADIDNETLKMDAQDMMNTTSDYLDDISHPKEEGSPYSSDIDTVSNNSISGEHISRTKSCGAIIRIESSDVTNDGENVMQSVFEEETSEKLVEAINLKAFDELNHDYEKPEGREDKTQISSEENVGLQPINLKVLDELNHDNEKLEDTEDKVEISFEEEVDQQPDNLKVFDELNHDNDKLDDAEDKIETSKEESADDELDHDNETLQDREDQTGLSKEENVDEQQDCSTPFKKHHDLKCQEQFGDNSNETNEDNKLECSLPNEDSVENLEDQKQIFDNHVSEVSSTEDESLECRNQREDNAVTVDEHLECENLIVDNHVTEDENVECQNHFEDNPMSVVSSIENDNVQDGERSEDNHVVEMEPSSDKLQDLTSNDSEVVDDSQLSSSNWSMDFEKHRREIIELWNACNVPLVHRTYFFLLFKGEPSDSIYMEVEQRRLSYLKGRLSRNSETSSLKALRREREKLRRQMQKKFSAKERESLYAKWGIAIKSKRRRLQLCSRLWTDTKNMEHVKESAALVAKMVGLVEPIHAPKEIFGLSLPPSSTSYRSSSWKSLPSLM